MDFEKMREIIAENLSCELDKVTMEADLADDLGADSLAAVELSMRWRTSSVWPSTTRTCPS